MKDIDRLEAKIDALIEVLGYTSEIEIDHKEIEVSRIEGESMIEHNRSSMKMVHKLRAIGSTYLRTETGGYIVVVAEPKVTLRLKNDE